MPYPAPAARLVHVLAALSALAPACYTTPVVGSDDGDATGSSTGGVPMAATGSDDGTQGVLGTSSGAPSSESETGPGQESESGAVVGTDSSSSSGGAPECFVDADCDDGDPCSGDLCIADVCEYEPLFDDPSCGCRTVDDCTTLPEDNACRTRTCEDNVCALDLVPDGTPLPETDQVAEDCLVAVCDGAGEVAAIDDDEDVPFDGVECTQDVCEAGVPSNIPFEVGTGCSAGSCDAAGNCVGCITAADCGGETTFCHTVTCEAGVCGVVETAADTPLPAADQTSNDCVELVCDGMGNAVPVDDDTDTPVDDGNDCTLDVCDNGAPSHPGVDEGTSCAGGVCDGGGSCVECIDATQCPAPGGCSVAACVGNVCGSSIAPSGTPCDDGLFCTQTDTCNAVGTCTGSGNPCPGGDGDSDCSESCNESTNQCTANDPSGSPCSDGLFCTSGDTCNGSGSCIGGGNPCPGADGDFDCTETCNEAANACSAPDPNGTPCSNCRACTNGVCQGGCTNPEACCDHPTFGDICIEPMFCQGI